MTSLFAHHQRAITYQTVLYASVGIPTGRYSRGAARDMQKEDDAGVNYDDDNGQNPLRPDADDVIELGGPSLLL